jgi:preprotein translocase subunit SecA
LKFGVDLDLSALENAASANIKEYIYEKMEAAYLEKEKNLGIELMRQLEYMVFLQVIDSKWKDHLYAMDSLREGIGLRAYGQRDPLLEYKREAFDMFNRMIANIEEEAVEAVFKMQPAKPERIRGVFSSLAQELLHPEITKMEAPAERLSGEDFSSPPQTQPIVPQRAQPKVGRNDPCPCHSGKKYKKCCGK